MSIPVIQKTGGIGRIVVNAAAFNPGNWGNTALNPESLMKAVEELFGLLQEREAEYALVGGIALRHYVEGRNTEHIDLVMTVSSLERVPEIQVVARDGDFIRGEFLGLRVDILLTQNPLFETVRRSHSEARRFGAREIPCATVGGLILLKLYALPSLYRQGDFVRVGLYEQDIASLMHAYKPDLEPLLAELAPRVSESDLSAVQDILGDIRRRIERFESGQGGKGARK